MGLRNLPRLIAVGLLLAGTNLAWAQPNPSSAPTEEIPQQKVTDWSLAKKKSLPNYNMEIYQRMTVAKFPRVEAMKIKLIPKSGGTPTEIEGTWLSADPANYIIGYKGGALDLDSDGSEDLLLQNYSGGGHCCYNYLIYSLKGNAAKKIADLPMKDCGEKISLEDLNGDKNLEIIACNPDYTYMGELPYSESPFPPAIYSMKNGEYQRADREFRQIFLDDIQSQRDALAKNYRPANVLQIVTDYLILGDATAAWKEFDSLYKGKDKDAVKAELAKRSGVKAPGGESTAASDASRDSK